MIKSKDGNVKIKGERACVLADLGAIFDVLIREADGIDVDDIKMILERAQMSTNELENLLMEKLQEVIDMMRGDEE